jgi:NAD(P)-dependent dehydrogenase (short-subunit alcohol dehydrogenase family)
MSKFAVEAYTESLAADLQDEGVYVGIIEPGGFKSKIREKVAMHNLTGHYSLEQKSIDQKLNDAQQAELQAAKERNEALKEPDEVAAAVIKALTSDKPKLRYMVAPNKAQADMTTRAALSRALQLNADHPYAFTREELVALLDELLAGK